MSHLQNELTKAKGVSRLNTIIRQLRSRNIPTPDDRAWFADLLASFEENHDRERLTYTSAPQVERSAMVQIVTDLIEEVGNRKGAEAALSELKNVMALHAKLTAGVQEFSETDFGDILRLAELMRRQLLESEVFHPSPVVRERLG